MSKTLNIVWQRLVIEGGETCPRCGTTGDAVEEAVTALTKALAPLGIAVHLETRTLDIDTFQADPGESNRIWIAGQPLETWLGGEAGASRCCEACGDADCRTLAVGGQTYEAIPASLILQAGLMALPHLRDDRGPAGQ